jgi:hypothetical protein
LACQGDRDQPHGVSGTALGHGAGGSPHSVTEAGRYAPAGGVGRSRAISSNRRPVNAQHFPYRRFLAALTPRLPLAIARGKGRAIRVVC